MLQPWNRARRTVPALTKDATRKRLHANSESCKLANKHVRKQSQHLGKQKRKLEDEYESTPKVRSFVFCQCRDSNYTRLSDALGATKCEFLARSGRLRGGSERLRARSGRRTSTFWRARGDELRLSGALGATRCDFGYTKCDFGRARAVKMRLSAALEELSRH